MKSNAKLMATSSVFTALSVLFLLLSVVAPLPHLWLMIAGLILLALYDEVGRKYTFCAYLAVSLLSFFLLPSITRAIDFTIFYGLYPAVLLPLINEKAKGKKKRLAMKGLVFTIDAAIVFFIINQMTGLSALQERLLANGNVFIPVILLISVALHFWYDYFVLKNGFDFYNLTLKPRIFKR